MKITPPIVIYATLFLLLSCSQSHKNKEEYNVKVGEEFEIFYTSNSCCGRCWNIEELDNVKFIGKRAIEENDNPGGTSTYAKIFKAVSPGIDTLKNYKYAMSDSCDLLSKNTNKYLIHISK